MQTPSCFGKHWNPQAVECKGGHDVTYTNPSNGGHVRDKCKWYSQCAPRTCANTMPAQPQAQQAPMVPTSQLVRTVQPAVRPPAPIAPAPPQYPLPQPQVQGYPPQQMVHPSQAYYGPQAVPVNQQQPGMQILGYLTNPEPVDINVPWWKRLGHEILRAMGKGAMHTGANFLDHTTFTPPKPPGTE